METEVDKKLLTNPKCEDCSHYIKCGKRSGKKRYCRKKPNPRNTQIIYERREASDDICEWFKLKLELEKEYVMSFSTTIPTKNTEPLKVSDLRCGRRIYGIDLSVMNIRTYDYVCVSPSQLDCHILQVNDKEHVVMHNKSLQRILNENLKTVDEAWLALANMFEINARKIRESIKNKEV